MVNSGGSRPVCYREIRVEFSVSSSAWCVWHAMWRRSCDGWTLAQPLCSGAAALGLLAPPVPPVLHLCFLCLLCFTCASCASPVPPVPPVACASLFVASSLMRFSDCLSLCQPLNFYWSFYTILIIIFLFSWCISASLWMRVF